MSSKEDAGPMNSRSYSNTIRTSWPVLTMQICIHFPFLAPPFLRRMKAFDPYHPHHLLAFFEKGQKPLGAYVPENTQRCNDTALHLFTNFYVGHYLLLHEKDREKYEYRIRMQAIPLIHIAQFSENGDIFQQMQQNGPRWDGLRFAMQL